MQKTKNWEDFATYIIDKNILMFLIYKQCFQINENIYIRNMGSQA